MQRLYKMWTFKRLKKSSESMTNCAQKFKHRLFKTSPEQILQNLFQAIALDDVKTTKSILAKNSGLLASNNHPESSNSFKYQLLYKAIFCKNKEMAEVLCNFFNKSVKLEVNDVTQKYLHLATQKGNVKITELLLKRGVKPQGREWNSADSLAYLFNGSVAETDRKEILIFLLNYGLDIDIKTYDGNNLLHSLIRFSNKDDKDVAEIAKIFINYGMSITEFNNSIYSPLEYSVVKENFKLVSLLINKGASVSRKGCHEKTPLHWASRFNEDESIVDLLISRCVDVNAKDEKGNTPLHDACFNQNAQIINSLLERGASINIQNNDGFTPFATLQLYNENSYEHCMHIMVKELSKLVFDNISIIQKDVDLINAIPKAKKIFEKCFTELNEMTSNFYAYYSYYDILSMQLSMKKLAYLTKNEFFVSEFKKNLHNYIFFRNDLKKILIEAIKIKNQLLIVEFRLNKLFGNYLPKTAIRKLADHLTVEDLPWE